MVSARQRDAHATVHTTLPPFLYHARTMHVPAGRGRGIARKLIAVIAAIAIASLATSPLCAQDDSPTAVAISGDRLSGFVLPVEPVAGDIAFTAHQALVWQVDDTKRLLLSGDVEVRIADFTFQSDEAVIWLNRIPSADGLINQVAVYFDQVEDPSRRAGLGASGNRLLVTGSARGEVALNATVVDERRASGREIVQRGEARLARYLRTLLVAPPPLEQYPQVDAPPREEIPVLVPGGPPPEVPLELPTDIEILPERDLPIFDPSGQIVFNAGKIEAQSGTEENIIICTGGLMVEYTDDLGDQGFSRLTLSAERGVIFTKPGPIADVPTLAADADFVRGIYLEGNVVATDGQYTVRGSRVYYDVQKQQALMLDGVLRTYTRDIATPVWARAEEFRQISRTQWQAEKAIVSTSEFWTPHLAIGARQVLVEQRPATDDDGERGAAAPAETYLDARDMTVELRGVPIFYWPQMAGTVRDLPIKSVSVGSDQNSDFSLETRWNLYSLFGEETPEGIDATLALDAFVGRGGGGGLVFEYEFPEIEGVADLYGIADSGIDKTATGRDVDSDQDFRGLALWEHQQQLSRKLTLQAQFSYISDETFISTWRESDFQERREYETSIYLRHLDDNTAWTLLAKGDLDDFMSNGWLIASRTYEVEKLPEFTYRRYGDSWFDDTVTYSGELRISNLRMSFIEATAEEMGLRAKRMFPGVPIDTPISELFEMAGFPERYIARADWRNEISIPGQVGIFDVTPFFVGRITGYDDEFANFTSDAEETRLFGAAGVRVSTELQHIDNQAESRLFDIHRLRHLVEPSMTLWYGYSNADQFDYPVFDEEVESLADATAIRLGLRNTWQTQRGGPGRWYSSDFLTVDTALVFTSSNADLEHPVPQFFEYRPEYSVLGDHWTATVVWLPSESLSIVNHTTYDLDDGRVALGSIGGQLRHSPAFATFAEFRYIEASDSELLDVGWNMQLTPKYSVGFSPQWDFRNDEFRAVRLLVTRKFPEFDITVSAKHDEIKGETSVSAQMQWTDF